MPRDFQARVLRDLWRKLNRFGDPACAVNLGGSDAAGNDQFNPLSALMVETSKTLRLPSPLLAARIHAGMPAAVFDALTNPALLAMGQPTFYGEEACRAALLRRGMPAAETDRFAVNSCMGLVIPGAEISDMWGAVVNLLLPLELTLNNGKPFAGALPVTLNTPPQAAYDSFEALYAQFSRYLDEIISLLVAANREATERAGRELPNPYLSALTADCIQRGRDRALGGARYHSVIVEGFGWCSVADAFTAIRQLEFETGRYPLAALTAAARNDYQGDEAIRHALLRCPKYGNSDPEADAMARRVLETFAALARRHERENVRYLPSCHTLNAHLSAGKKIPASLDGRRAGDALGKNLGPLVGRNTQGLTALLLSASALDQAALSGGQALDISLEPSLIRTAEGRRKLQAALLAYFKRGGLQIQVNGASADELRAAMADPEAHRDLLVRIAGYSARFVTLSREIQEEMIQRFAHGL